MNKLKNWAKRLKIELVALQISLTRKDTPVFVKVLILITLAYLFSPIDLIPDFIPVLGLLDDVILVPLLIFLIIRLMPNEIMEECRRLAATKSLNVRKNWLMAFLIILL